MGVGKAWTNYSRRKTRLGIVIDFAFLLAVLILVVAPLRRGLMTYALRLTISEPERYDKLLYVDESDSFRLQTPSGADTLIGLPPDVPCLFNVGNIWSPQSRAELRSLNQMALKFDPWIRVYFIATNPHDEASRYLQRKGYTSLRLLTATDIEQIDNAPNGLTGLMAEMVMSEPASLLIDTAGRVRLKKMGAAKWTGSRIDKILMETIMDAGHP